MNSIKKFLKKEKQSTSPSDAIAKLRDIEEMFAKKQEYLEGRIKNEIDTARANGTTNKRIALQALKRKKRFENQLKQIDGTLATIEMQREALESATTNTCVLTTMKNAAEALKIAHNKMRVDDVIDITDEIMEQQQLAKEIADAISAPLASSDVDDDDLLKELEELEQQELDQALLQTPILPSVPAANIPGASRPKTPGKPSKSSDDADDELRQLQDWAS